LKHNELSGWVNQNFLFKDETPQARNLDSIAGIEWTLRAWKNDEPAPASPAVTLMFENGKFVGRSGCNRYSSTVTEGRASGSIKVGPTISTRMACPEPAMAIENRFLKQLEAVTKFDLSSDQLALSYEVDGAAEVMLFEKK
jgi:heat shock protein HslJ